MNRPLLFLFFVCYTAAAIYSVGRTGSSATTTFKATFKPTRLVSNRVLLTTGNMDTMTQFYNEVFKADLQPSEEEEMSALACQQGALSGVPFLLCPGAKPKAAQARPPLRFAVSDLAEAKRRIEAAGGEVANKAAEADDEKLTLMRDPDGNAIELIQMSK
jgi:predicted enzyme related to lactoylglutathione lyase